MHRYEVMYHQLGLTKVLEYIQLGLLDPKKVITMRVRNAVGICTVPEGSETLLPCKHQLFH